MTRVEELVLQITQLVQAADGGIDRSELAEQLGVKRSDQDFYTALKLALDSRRIAKRVTYELSDAEQRPALPEVTA